MPDTPTYNLTQAIEATLPPIKRLRLAVLARLSDAERGVSVVEATRRDADQTEPAIRRACELRDLEETLTCLIACLIDVTKGYDDVGAAQPTVGAAVSFGDGESLLNKLARELDPVSDYLRGALIAAETDLADAMANGTSEIDDIEERALKIQDRIDSLECARAHMQVALSGLRA